MYDNIGGKIKWLAKTYCVILSAYFIFIGARMLMTSVSASVSFKGLFLIVFGTLASWISSWALYGLGELICSQEATESLLRRTLSSLGIDDM